MISAYKIFFYLALVTIVVQIAESKPTTPAECQSPKNCRRDKPGGCGCNSSSKSVKPPNNTNPRQKGKAGANGGNLDCGTCVKTGGCKKQLDCVCPSGHCKDRVARPGQSKPATGRHPH